MPHALHFACMTYFCTVFFLLLYLRSLSCRYSCYSFSSFSSIFRSTTLSIHTYVTAFNTVPCGWKIHHLPVCVHTKKNTKSSIAPTVLYWNKCFSFTIRHQRSKYIFSSRRTIFSFDMCINIFTVSGKYIHINKMYATFRMGLARAALNKTHARKISNGKLSYSSFCGGIFSTASKWLPETNI